MNDGRAPLEIKTAKDINALFRFHTQSKLVLSFKLYFGSFITARVSLKL